MSSIPPLFESRVRTLVFAGAGLSTLSLVMRLIANGVADTHQIVLLDKDRKQANDRTWCFWEQGTGFFDEIVFRKWARLDFFSKTFNAELDIAPYQYKMIRGIDFYRHCLHRIAQHPQIEFRHAEVAGMEESENQVKVQLKNGESLTFENAAGFNSIPAQNMRRKGDINLLQHFKGWIIQTTKPAFEVGKATLMDFRVSQELGTTFVYVLPLSENEALVEYTLFTEKLLEPSAYDAALQNYCREYLKIENYTIKEEEFGIIPMTNVFFPGRVNGVLQLGTAGGQTKASSGYTFQFIQKQADAIARALQSNQNPVLLPRSPWRFRFYDHTLLHLLYNRQYPGDKIFATLFQKNPATRVLRFLDNESNLNEEIKLLWSLPAWPFLKAALQKRRTH